MGRTTIDGMDYLRSLDDSQPLVFVKYEALYDHLKDISLALCVDIRRFPPQWPRKLQPTEDVPERLVVLRESGGVGLVCGGLL